MIDNKIKAQVVRYIRQLFRQSEVFKQIKENSVHPTIKGSRGGKRYMCSFCKCANTANEIQVDHINPVVPKKTKQKYMTIDEYVNRLYCSVSNLQVLCFECHKIKTTKERK